MPPTTTRRGRAGGTTTTANLGGGGGTGAIGAAARRRFGFDTTNRGAFERLVMQGFVSNDIGIDAAMPFDEPMPITMTAVQMQEMVTMRRRQSEEQAARNADQARVNALPITINTERVNDDGYEFYKTTIVRGDGRVLDEYHSRNEREAKEAVRDLRVRWADSRTADSMGIAPEGTTLLDIRADRYIVRRNDGRRTVDRRSVRPADDVVAEDGLVLDIPADDAETGVFQLEIDQF